MASKTSIKSAKVASPGELGDSKAASKIRFSATLLRPKATANAVSWTFLTLPKEASAKLPSRSMTSVEGTFNGLAFQASLEPDGQGGHWLKVDRKMRKEAGAEAGEVVTLEIAPVAAQQIVDPLPVIVAERDAPRARQESADLRDTFSALQIDSAGRLYGTTLYGGKDRALTGRDSLALGPATCSPARSGSTGG